jgi:hypothetical protein
VTRCIDCSAVVAGVDTHGRCCVCRDDAADLLPVAEARATAAVAAQLAADAARRPCVPPPATDVAYGYGSHVDRAPAIYTPRPSRILAAIRAAEVCSDALRTASPDAVTTRPGATRAA